MSETTRSSQCVLSSINKREDGPQEPSLLYVRVLWQDVGRRLWNPETTDVLHDHLESKDQTACLNLPASHSSVPFPDPPVSPPQNHHFITDAGVGFCPFHLSGPLTSGARGRPPVCNLPPPCFPPANQGLSPSTEFSPLHSPRVAQRRPQGLGTVLGLCLHGEEPSLGCVRGSPCLQSGIHGGQVLPPSPSLLCPSR